MMKKSTSLVAALCLATAFSGMCVGCASNIAENGESTETPQAALSATTEATEHKVILNPGWYWTSGATEAVNNTVGSGAVELKADESETYHVENGYFATVAAGEELPEAVTTRADTTFVSWMYAKDGNIVTVDKMPSSLTEDLYLFAKWKTDGDENGGGSGGEAVIDGVSVNGHRMIVNSGSSGDTTIQTEYMLTGETFAEGETLVFKLDGEVITISELETSSTGVSKSGNTITVTKGGTFDFYLKLLTTGTWKLYGSRTIDASEITRVGERLTANNCYLVGNVAGTDVQWTDTSKGFKTALVGNYYEITIKLTAGDNVKFVMPTAAGTTNGASWWRSIISSSSDSSALHNDNDNNKNITIDKSGTFTFKVSRTSDSIIVTYSA